MATTPYEILVGVGTLYVAVAGTAAPATVGTTPSSAWTNLGDTDGGVTITKEQNIELFRNDQSTAPKKAVRTEEDVVIETNLAKATLENLVFAINGTVTDTPPGAGTIGTRTLKMYKGADVTQYAFLFRGSSPYGAFPGQFYIPVGVFLDDIGMEFKKDEMTLIPIKFAALENPSASTEADRFGLITYQDAAAI